MPAESATPVLLTIFLCHEDRKESGQLTSFALISCLSCTLRNSGNMSCRAPDDVQKRAVLAMVVKTLAGLHGSGIVHGALSPSAVVWHSRDNAMKAANLCCAAAPGDLAPLSPTLRYSPPEVRCF